MVDMAHIAGLVAAGLHQNPVDYAAVSYTHLDVYKRQGFLLWPAAIFLILSVLCYGQTGETAVVITIAGIIAFLAGQTQWGFMLSLLMGASAAERCV